MAVLYAVGHDDGRVSLIVLHHQSFKEMPRDSSDYRVGLDLIVVDATAYPATLVCVPLVTLGEMPADGTFVSSIEIDAWWDGFGSEARVIINMSDGVHEIRSPVVETICDAPTEPWEMEIDDVAYFGEDVMTVTGGESSVFGRHVSLRLIGVARDTMVVRVPVWRRFDKLVAHVYSPIGYSVPSLSVPHSLRAELQRLREEVNCWWDGSALDEVGQISLGRPSWGRPEVPRTGRSPPLDRKTE